MQGTRKALVVGVVCLVAGLFPVATASAVSATPRSASAQSVLPPQNPSVAAAVAAGGGVSEPTGFDFNEIETFATVSRTTPWGMSSDYPEDVIGYQGQVLVIADYSSYLIPTDGSSTTEVWPGNSSGGRAAADSNGFVYGGDSRYHPDLVTAEHHFFKGVFDREVYPDAMALGPGGHLWGAGGRGFWEWTTDGVLRREYNAYAASGGGDPRWPDDPSDFAWDDDGVLYALGDDGLFRFSHVEDLWPERGEDPYQGDWLMHFDQLLTNKTSWSSPPPDGYDMEDDLYNSGLVFHAGRLWWTRARGWEWGSAPRIYSVKTDGSDLRIEYEGNAADGTDDAYFQGLNVINGDLYVAGNVTSSVYRFPRLRPHTIRASEVFGPSAAMRGYCPCRGTTQFPVDTQTGNEHWPLPGVSIPGRGPALNFQLAHNSQDADYDGPVGFGWRHSYDMQLREEPDGTRTIVQETGATVPFRPMAGGGWVTPGLFDASLVDNGDGSWTFQRGRFSFYDFDAQGRLVAVRDLNGNRTELVYDTAGRLDHVEDSAGRRLEFVWANGRIASVTDPLDSPEGPRTITFQYSLLGNLTNYTDIGGGVWVMTYDLLHRIVTARTPRHSDPTKVIRNHYDLAGRVDWQEDAAGRRTKLHYDDPVPGATRIVHPDGDVQVDWYDTYGRRYQVTHGYGTPEETSQHYTYAPMTNMVTATTDGEGRTWTSVYGDPTNPYEVTASTDPLGRTTTSTYNDLGLPVTVTDADGVTTTFEYDSAGNLEKTTTGAGTPVEEMVDLVRGNLAHPDDVTARIDERGKTWTFDHDPATGYVTGTTDPEGNTTSVEYNNIGWVVATVAAAGNLAAADPSLHRSTFEHNGYGDVTSATNPTGEQTSTAYDANRNVVSVTDPAGHVTTRTYTDADELATETIGAGTPEAATTTWTYNPDGTVDSRTDPLGGVWGYDYDAVGRVIGDIDPLGRRTGHRYDRIGNLVQTEQPGGDCTATPATGCITRTYDDANQLTAVEYSDPATPDVSEITYDNNGRKTAVTVDGNGTMTWTYDAHGRVLSHTDPTAATTLTYTWSPGGLLATILYPEQTVPVTYGYDDAGRMTSVTDWNATETAFDYDANSNLTTVASPTVTDTFGYDRANRIETIAWTAGSTQLGSLNYTRTANGLLAGVTTTGLPDGPTTYGYDARDQLTSAEDVDFAYDLAGNVTRHATAQHQSFDAAGQLTASTGQTITQVQATSTSQASGTNLTIGYDPDVSADDQAILAVTVPKNRTVATPSGFQLIGRYDAADAISWLLPGVPLLAGQAASMVLFRSTVPDGARGASISFNQSTAASAALTVYRGVNPINPLRAVTSSTGSGSTLTFGSIAASAGDTLVTVAGSLAPGTWTADPQTTLRTQHAGSGTDVMVADQTIVDGETSGSRTLTHTPTGSMSGAMLALVPEQVTYNFDDRGNRTTTSSDESTTTYGYDQANQLTSVGTSTTYRYNPAGLRSAKTTGQQTATFTWSDGPGIPLLLSTTDEDGTTNLIYGPGGRIVAQIDTNGTTSWMHQDHLGSIRLVTDDQGNPTGTYTYDSYGQLTASTGAATPLLGFAGEYHDPDTGLIYLRARHYDPATAQFLTRDPFLDITQNPYSYADNSPTNFTDPAGLAPCGEGPPSSVQHLRCLQILNDIERKMQALRGKVRNLDRNVRGEVLGDRQNLGHQEAFKNLQTGLRNSLAQFNSNGCAGLGFTTPEGAWELATRPVPPPNQDPGRFRSQRRASSWPMPSMAVDGLRNVGAAIGLGVLVILSTPSSIGNA